MLRPLSAALAAVLFYVVPAWSQEVTGYDRFKLWNDCGLMQLVVEKLNTDASDIGLRKEVLETSVRSRLRAARIYGSEAKPYLYVNVGVSGRAFSIEVSYNKILNDVISSETGYAITWTRGGTGTHGRDSSYIVSLVSKYTDEFIDEYLRVNEIACRR